MDSQNKLNSQELLVVVFSAAYLLAALVAAVVTRSSEFVFYIVIVLVLAALVWILHRRVQLPAGALWGLSIWGLAHMAGGLMPIPESWPRGADSTVLYNWWIIPSLLKFDQLVHAYGFGLVTWITWWCITQMIKPHGVAVRPSLGWLVVCVAAGMGFGAANEVVEFVATLTLPKTNVGDYANTGWDMVANLVGCLIAATAIRLTWRPR